MSDVQNSYDKLAQEYANHLYTELGRKPFDRKMLDWLIEKVNDRGTICDMGCGPAQVARYMKDKGVDVCGVDLSPQMVEEAKRLNPDIPVSVGNMLDLKDIPDNNYAGIAAFYSIVNIPREQILTAFQELCRVMMPGGVLLLTFHVGEEVRHLDQLFDVPDINLDFVFFDPEAIKGYLQAVGFRLEEVIERDSYPEGIEAQTRRSYIFAVKES